jgi:hypothetical protein
MIFYHVIINNRAAITLYPCTAFFGTDKLQCIVLKNSSIQVKDIFGYNKIGGSVIYCFHKLMFSWLKSARRKNSKAADEGD